MAGTSKEVPGLYPISLNGRAYLLDLSLGAFRRKTVPLLRPQADTGNIPGKQSVNPEDLWRRDQETWHFGAGQNVFDREDSRSGRYRNSKGIDPWERWEISLLPGTERKEDDEDDGHLIIATDQYLYWATGASSGAELLRTTDPSGSSPSWTTITNLDNDPIESLATDGDIVWIAQGDDGVYQILPSATAASSYAGVSSVTASLVAYVKGRLMVADAENGHVWNVTASGTTLTSSNTLFTHDNDSFAVTGFGEGPGHIYFCGNVGGRGEIYRITIQPQGTTLDAPILAGELPVGETVHAILGYLGFLVLGTSRGVRVAALDGNGDLTIGPLIETDEQVDALAARGRFVWFSGFQDSSNNGVYRLDLSVFTDPLKPAYAPDLMIGTALTDRVMSMAFFGDRLYMGVKDNGLWGQTAALVSEGSIESGDITFGLADPKVAMFENLTFEALAGSIEAYLKVDSGTYQLLGSATTEDSTSASFSIAEASGRTFETKLVLKRDSSTTSAGPTVKSQSLRAEPRPRRSELITLPILLHEAYTVGEGVSRSMDPKDELRRLRALAAASEPCTYKEMDTSIACFVKDVEWVPQSETEDGKFWNGVAVVTIRTVPDYEIEEDLDEIDTDPGSEADPDPVPDDEDDDDVGQPGDPEPLISMKITDFSASEGSDTGDLDITALEDGIDTDGGTSVTTGSFEPTADALVLVAIVTGSSSPDNAAAPSGVSGNGITYDKIADVNSSNNRINTSLWRGMSSSPSSGALTISYSSAMDNCIWQVVEIEGVTTGNNGADAIVQSKTSSTGISFDNPTITLDTAPTDGNALFAVFGKNSTSAEPTAGNGFAIIGVSNEDGDPTAKIFCEYDLDVANHDGVFDMTWTNSSGVANVGVEVEASGSAGATKTFSVTVSISDVRPHDLKFDYVTTAGTATADEDYITVSSGTGTITAGQTSTTIDIEVAQDEIPEEDETFIVTISNARNSTTDEVDPEVEITDAEATVTIQDDDSGSSTPPSSDGLKIMYGWYQDGNNTTIGKALETALSKNFACYRYYDGDNKGTPSSTARAMAEGGRLLLWSAKANDWGAVADTTEDSWIEAVGMELQSWDVDEVVFIFYHEPHDDVNGTTRTAAKYRDAWRRIHDVFRENDWLRKDGNGGKILLGYCGIDWKVYDLAKDEFWPGADVIDVLCHDFYNKITDDKNKSPANVLFGWPDDFEKPNNLSSMHFGRLIQLSEQVGRPMIIGEWGCIPQTPPEDHDEFGFGFNQALKDVLTAEVSENDRDGWFKQAAEWMTTNELARKWLAGFCYYHARGWMFLDNDGDYHPTGEARDSGGNGDGVEGKDGWVAAFVNDGRFVSTPQPLYAADGTPQFPRGTTQEAPSSGTCTATDWDLKATAGGLSGVGEVSGITATPNHANGIWAVRDTGNPASIYWCAETSRGQFSAAHEIPVTGASNGDWEDLNYYNNALYIHDNRGNSSTSPKRLYKVTEPATNATSASIAATYYWQFPSDVTGDTCGGKFNCEAMGIFNGTIYVVRKKSATQSEVYSLGAVDSQSTDPDDPTEATQVGTIGHSCPSSFAVSDDGTMVITVSHGRVKVWRGTGDDIESILTGENELVFEDRPQAINGKSANTESATWYPLDGCNFLVVSESQTTYDYEEVED